MPDAFPLPDPALTDGSVLLRPLTAADVPAIYAACQAPDIQHFTFVPVPYAMDHAREWVGGAARAREQGEALSLAIVDVDDGGLVGTVALLRPDWQHRTVEIGYWVAPWGRRNGAATRAVALLAPWAIRTLAFARVACDVDIDNVASQRVAERAGFTRDGVLRSLLEIKGRRWTLAAYSLTEEDLAS
ncbi:acetyltransferase [Baekduia alba]|uniref:GNAT family N-acetyltransferase n=1 Tax=Baekduia alba TaxID=2997333 RepID=UPI0023411FA9|nr:GNAT family N-acetyltransferase [Baekduia alba]WCB93990.1 acetyltransferase [Baekduia alba]